MVYTVYSMIKKTVMVYTVYSMIKKTVIVYTVYSMYSFFFVDNPAYGFTPCPQTR